MLHVPKGGLRLEANCSTDGHLADCSLRGRAERARRAHGERAESARRAHGERAESVRRAR
eukprot:7567440-Alexandrium_andersonii.AAC.1